MQLDQPQKALLEILGVTGKHILYQSNIGYIIVPQNGDFVYKLFIDIDIYQKELKMYKVFMDEGLLLPKFEGLGFINGLYICKLQNIRKQFKRKNMLKDLDLCQLAIILNTIHTIDLYKYFEKGNCKSSLILGDIHSSNFFETINDIGDIQLGIFDFSSVGFGEKEEDIADIYIDLSINDDDLQKFLSYYKGTIDKNKLYKYTFLELKERINNGMNLEAQKKKDYYKYMLIMRAKIATYIL